MNKKSAGEWLGKAAGFSKPVSDPWQIAAEEIPSEGTPAEQLWFAISHAVLAPSTHNTQPWRFAMHESHVDMQGDFSRSLPVVDPQGRELIMSCGAALFHLRLALQYLGSCPKIELFPDVSRPDWLARVHQGARAEIDTNTILLFQAIPQRRTHRQRFRPEAVAPALLSELESAANSEGAWLQVITDDSDRAAVADLVAEGDRRQWADKQFRKELAAWTRPLGSDTRDGLPMTTQDLGSLLSHAGPLVIRTFDLGKGHAAKDLEIALHSPILAVIGTDSDEAAAWLAAGQALARVLLLARTEQVSASFLNQPIEVPQLRPCLSDILARQGFPQLLLRMGYADPVPHTPRRTVSEVVRFHEPG